MYIEKLRKFRSEVRIHIIADVKYQGKKAFFGFPLETNKLPQKVNITSYFIYCLINENLGMKACFKINRS